MKRSVKGLWLRPALFCFLVLLLIVTGCGVSQIDRLSLVEEIKAFEKQLGFDETENFKVYSAETEAYDYYFYTSATSLPYSLGDPSLQYGEGKPPKAVTDSGEYDVFIYSVEAIAGVKTPITKSLLRAPLSRFIHVIFHEDWHEQIASSLGIEESSGEVVAYTAALLFTEKKFGQDSAVYQDLRDEFRKKLAESEIYRQYYDKLSALYAQFQAGEISEPETLAQKAELLRAMSRELWKIWGGKPGQLNNAFIAFQMTYYRHLSLMYEVFSATNFNLAKTMSIFRAMPNQGVEFGSVEELKQLENEITDYLRQAVYSGSFSLPPISLSRLR